MSISGIIALIVAVASAAYSLATQPKDQLPPGTQVSKHSANEGLKIVYGYRRVPATKVFKFSSNQHVPVTQTNMDNIVNDFDNQVRKHNNWLHRIDVWCQGPINNIEHYWIDGDLHTNERFTKKKNWFFRAVEYYGAVNQTAFTDLSAGNPAWTSAHKGQGVCYSATRFFADLEGKPQYRGEPDVHAHIKGRSVYDPRLDSTQSGGSGSHRHNNAASWAFSENPALCLMDFLTQSYGRNLTIGQVHVESFMIAADQCDSSVNIPPRLQNDTGGDITNWWDPADGTFKIISDGQTFPQYRKRQAATNSQVRCRCNLVLDPKNQVVENVRKILETMKGSLPFSQGKLKLIVEDAVNSVAMSFDEDTIVGGLRISRGDRSARMNQVTIEFPNENTDYKKDHVTWPETDSATHLSYVADDNNQKLHQLIKIDGVTEAYQAEDLAEFIVRDSRASLRVETTLTPIGTLLEPGDVIALTHSSPSWVRKWFRVRKVEITPSSTAKVHLTEYDSSVYFWAPKTNEQLNSPTNDHNPWEDPAIIANPLATPFHDVKDDGSVISGFDVTWDEPDGTANLENIRVSYKKTADADFDRVVALSPETVTTRIEGLQDDVEYKVNIQSVSKFGIVSDDSIDTQTLTAATSTKLGGIQERANRVGIANAVSDPNFELTDADGFGSSFFWERSNASVAIDATGGEDGGVALKMTADGTNLAAISTDRIYVKAGDKIFVRANVWVDNAFTGTGVDFRCELSEKDKDDASTSFPDVFDTDDITKGVWAMVSGSVVVGGATTEYARIRLHINSSEVAGFVSVDQIQAWLIPTTADNALQDFADVIGGTKPANNATVGGELGVNVDGHAISTQNVIPNPIFEDATAGWSLAVGMRIEAPGVGDAFEDTNDNHLIYDIIDTPTKAGADLATATLWGGGDLKIPVIPGESLGFKINAASDRGSDNTSGNDCWLIMRQFDSSDVQGSEQVLKRFNCQSDFPVADTVVSFHGQIDADDADVAYVKIYLRGATTGTATGTGNYHFGRVEVMRQITPHNLEDDATLTEKIPAQGVTIPINAFTTGELLSADHDPYGTTIRYMEVQRASISSDGNDVLITWSGLVGAKNTSGGSRFDFLWPTIRIYREDRGSGTPEYEDAWAADSGGDPQCKVGDTAYTHTVIQIVDNTTAEDTDYTYIVEAGIQKVGASPGNRANIATKKRNLNLLEMKR